MDQVLLFLGFNNGHGFFPLPFSFFIAWHNCPFFFLVFIGSPKLSFFSNFIFSCSSLLLSNKHICYIILQKQVEKIKIKIKASYLNVRGTFWKILEYP